MDPDRPTDPLSDGSPGEATADAIDSAAAAAHTPGIADPDVTVDVAGGDGMAPSVTVRSFGDYEILGELGRGGMGVVYRARQVSLNRPVALKMVKTGLLASDDELRRFQNEAETVALLDHPGVVPIYEVGAHDGQRYISMRLVEGGSLVSLLGRYRGDPWAVARLTAEAAEAVAHAHARGILHRDLKPANILVDAEGRPHVTDFGLAKRVEADAELTASGAILGTPAYMSPEQATGRRGAITTATDVYGLGSVLYALLTGRAPFGGDSVAETLDAVRNALPEPPRRLVAAVPRDLETICLKCLEKDPRRRYPTAQALADDLRRWIDSRPIAARRVGPAERAWLWCRRRPAIASLVAAALLALIGGTAATIAVQVAANRALAAKNVELASANARVEQRYDLAMEAIKSFHTGVSEDFLLREVQFKGLRDRLLNSASDFYERLGALLGEEPDLASRRALSQAGFEVAVLAGQVGRQEDALALHRRVLAGREALAAAQGADPATAVDVARSLLAIGKALEATGQMAEALATLERARSTLAGADGSPPEDAAGRSTFAAVEAQSGLTLMATGRTAEALHALERAHLLQDLLARADPGDHDRQADLAATHNLIGMVRTQTGRPAEALEAYGAARAIWSDLADAHPAIGEFRNQLADAYSNIGAQLGSTGRPAEALEAIKAARAVRQRLAEEQPAVTALQRDLAASHFNAGILLAATGRPAEALEAYEAAREIQRRLADDNPQVTHFRADLARSDNNIGALLAVMGKPATALEAHRAARAVRQRLAEEHPQVVQHRADLADSHGHIATLLAAMGRPLKSSSTGPTWRTAMAISPPCWRRWGGRPRPWRRTRRCGPSGSGWPRSTPLSSTTGPTWRSAITRSARSWGTWVSRPGPWRRSGRRWRPRGDWPGTIPPLQSTRSSWGLATITSLPCWPGRASRPRPWRRTGRRGRSGRRWPTPTPRSRRTVTCWRAPTPEQPTPCAAWAARSRPCRDTRPPSPCARR